MKLPFGHKEHKAKTVRKKTRQKRVVSFQKKCDIFVSGVGGLGVLTLARIIAEAGLKEGLNVKTEEFHGLAQRYGAIHAHVRLGRDIHSAIIPAGQSDLIISLEPLEALRAAYYGSKQAGTVFLVNTAKIYPLTCFVEGQHYPPLERIINQLKRFSKKVYAVNASESVKRQTGKTISSNIYMLGMASGLNLLPISRKHLLDALSAILRKRFVEQNIKVFETGEKVAKRMH